MRKSKNLEIDKKKITVYELTVKEIIEIGEGKGKRAGTGIKDFRILIKEYLPKCVSGITFDELIEMPPSDLKLIYNDFQEVNSVFFEAARSMGLGELLNELKEAVQKDFLKLLVDSFPGDT